MDERCISCELLCIIISVYIHRQKHLSNISHSTEISATSESSQPDQISPIYQCDLGLTSFPAQTTQVFLLFHDLCRTWRRSFLLGKFRQQVICSGIQLTSLGAGRTYLLLFHEYY